MTWQKEVQRVSLLGLPFLLLASVFSVGMIYPDEHFQTLEFASYKAGHTSVEALPWEFGARIRPWLQPSIYYALIQFWRLLHWEDPFFWAFTFRLLSALLTFLALRQASFAIPHWIKDSPKQRIALWAMWLAFFVPMLAARTSSETLSGVFVLLSLSGLTLHFQERGLFLAGLLFGVAFQFRYQIGFMGLGIFLWLWFIRHAPARLFLLFTMGILGATLMGALVDRWGYGSWTFTAWNYLRVNLLEGKAASFGVLPFWGYFPLAWQDIVKPFGLVLFVGTLLGWRQMPKSLITWTTVPFFLAQCFIGHKESRFLYPMAHLAVILSVAGLAEFAARVPRWILGTFVSLNLIAFLILTFRPLQSEFSILRWIRSAPETALFYVEQNPYEIAPPLKAEFFYRPDLKVEGLPNATALLDRLNGQEMLFYRTGHGVQELEVELTQRCQLEMESGVYKLLPAKLWETSWLEKVAARNRFFRVFRCR